MDDAERWRRAKAYIERERERRLEEVGKKLADTGDWNERAYAELYLLDSILKAAEDDRCSGEK